MTMREKYDTLKGRSVLLYLHWTVSEEIEIHVLTEQITFRVRGVKLLSSHEEVTRKVIPFWGGKKSQAD